MTESGIDGLRVPGEESCLRVMAMLGDLPGMELKWSRQRAPGFLAPSAADGRELAEIFDGWSRLTVPSEYDDIEGDGYYTIVNNGMWRLPLPELGEPLLSRQVALPDEWQQDRNFHHAWYGRRVDIEGGEGKSFWLRFDAVSHACAVFVNGRQAGQHQGGYTPFECDITSLVRSGENTILLWVQDETAVRDSRKRRMTGMLDCRKGAVNANLAGIRGGVYLEIRQHSHLARVRVRPSTRKGVLQVESWVRTGAEGVVVRQSVYEWPNGATPVLEMPESKVSAVGAGETDCVENEVRWRDAKLWSPDHPHLYVLRTTIIGAAGSESYDTRFGFREFWIEGRDFVLNGKPIRLFGDGGLPREYLSVVPGASRDYCRRVFGFLKREFNYTSARLHKCVFPLEVIQAADEVGVICINQSGLHSAHQAMFRNGGEELLRNLEVEIGEWYWRDVNSPALVIWDMENELIRGQREPEWLNMVLRLDDIIRKLDPDAIIGHSGAAWYHPDQQMIHVHMQEHYSRIMSEWSASGKVPLKMGEFWMGGNGETRLPNSYEYSDREDWHREEARLYREKMLEMRYHGVSAIMPHRLTHWPLLKGGPILSQQELGKLVGSPYRWRFETIRNEGARGIAPVVGFVWPRMATVVTGDKLEREVVVCNDREDACVLSVVCEYGDQSEDWEVELEPARQRRLPVSFVAVEGVASIMVTVRDANGDVVESDCLAIHGISAAGVEIPVTKRRIIVVPALNDQAGRVLDALGIHYSVADALPGDASDTIVLVPEGSADDALGRSSRAVQDYLNRGGRLLSLAQDVPPRWLPLGLPFWPAARTSWPTYTGAGWEANNKDLNFTSAAPCYALGHPAFEHLTGVDFSDWAPVDGRISDDAFIRPNAVNMRAGGAYRVLLGATRRENASIIEYGTGQGTAVFCQARVLCPGASPAARAVFFNLLRYLDGPAWASVVGRVGLIGDLDAGRLASMTGIDESVFSAVSSVDDAPKFVVAGDNADVDLIIGLATKGATVLVLSTQTCGQLPGYAVEQDADAWYSGTRSAVDDHPQFWGVASGSFLPLKDTPVRGALVRFPDDARILLGGHCRGHSPFGNDWSVDIGFYGLETREPAPPLAVVQSMGEGELIATTIEPWEQQAETHQQLLLNLLANAGIIAPCSSGQALTIDVKHTIPLCFDGNLDDWTNDMDDINISMHSHAQPIALTSKHVVDGNVAGDLDLSGVLYLLYDEQSLYVGGIVFPLGAAVALELDIDSKAVVITPGAKEVLIDGRDFALAEFAVGQQPANAVIDTHLLNLVKMNKQLQKAEAQTGTPGTTFELALPWCELGFDSVPNEFKARFRLSCQGTGVLASPIAEVDGVEFFEFITRPPILPPAHL